MSIVVVTFTRYEQDSSVTEHQTEHTQGVTVVLGGPKHEPTIMDVAQTTPVAHWAANSGRWSLTQDWRGGALNQHFDDVFIQAKEA